MLIRARRITGVNLRGARRKYEAPIYLRSGNCCCATADKRDGRRDGGREPGAPAGVGCIASHAATAPIFEPEFLPTTYAGYFRVTTDDGQLAPVYWMPAGSAQAAPPEIQAMPAYRANVANGTASRSGVIIYDEGVALVAPAGANDCPNGWSCLWQGWDFTGRMLQFHDPGSWQNMAWYTFNNDASSSYNRKADRATLYASEGDGGGALACLYAGQTWPRMDSFWDNNISSIRIKDGNNC